MMKWIPGVFALILCFGSSALLAEGGRQPSIKTIYEDNPYVSVGALRLDVTKDVEAQVPAGWRSVEAVPDPYRLVKFSGPVGGRQRESLAAAGYEVVAYHPFNSFLVRPRHDRPTAKLASLEGVSWTGAFHPYFKLADVLAQALAAGDASPFVVAESDWGLRFNIRLHEQDSRLRAERSIASAPGVVTVFPTRTLPIRVRVAPADFAAFLQRVAALPEVVAIEPWIPRKVHNDENVQVGQSGVCVNNGNEAPNTTIFAHGITGWDSRLAVADSCTDSNEGWWYDDALARLPAHETTFPWNSSEPDWAQRKMIEYYDMYSGDTTIGCAGGDQHGTHVAGIVTGNCSLNAEGIATRTDAANSDGDQDGMAPGSKIIPQDLGNGSLAYLNSDGGTLGELYSVAFENTCDGADCGIDAHNDSWGADFNTYDYDAYSGDDALWRLQRGVIVTSAGNAGSNYNTIGTPATAKNVIAVGNATNCNVDILSGGSSRGKTSDGRIKPDVVAGGSQVTSAVNDGNGSTNSNGGCGTNTESGTSMSSPTVAGYAGLVVQYFTDGFYPSGSANAFDWLEPSGPLLKAMLINTSQRMNEPTTAERNGVSWPNMDQGWGFVVLDNSLYFAGDSRKLWVHDETAGVDVSGTSSMTFRRKVVNLAEPLKVTLVWYDPGHAGSCGGGTPCLDNDLDLTVTEEGTGTVWTTTLVTGTAGHVVPRTVVPFPPVDKGQTSVDNGPDDLNTIEQIIIYNTSPGRTYAFTVTASNTPSGSVPFALVATGDLTDPCDAPTGAPAITAVDVNSCSNGGVQVSWSQDPTAWNDGDSGTRSYRVFRDGLPIAAGGCSGNLGYGTTSCIDSEGPDNFSVDYRVEYVSGCGTTVKTAEVAATDGVDFFVDVLPNGSSVCPGDTIVLTTEVEPAGTYTYQWTEDGADIAGETSSTLTVTKGAVASHSYNCRVTDPSSCANVDTVPVIGSWIDDPPDVEFNPASVPQNTLDEICGDGDGDVEPGEIWGLDVGLINRSACTTATDVTADLEINQSAVNAEICNPNGEFGALDPLLGGTDGFAFKVDEADSCPNSMTFDVTNINWSGGGGNFDSGAFAVTVTGACNVTTTCSCSTIALDEVSGGGSAVPLIVTRTGSLVDLSFAKNGATNYNVYVSTEASTQPFQVGSSDIGKKDCAVPWNSQLGGKAVILGYDVEAGIGGGSGVYYILVTGDDGPATEASLGVTSGGTGRAADSHCAD